MAILCLPITCLGPVSLKNGLKISRNEGEGGNPMGNTLNLSKKDTFHKQICLVGYEKEGLYRFEV